MASNKQYNFNVDLSGIPYKNGINKILDWSKSVGVIIPFTSDKINGELKITDYIPHNKSSEYKNSCVLVQYKNEAPRRITIQGLKRGALGGLLLEELFEWDYNIGDTIITNRLNLEIIDRKYINRQLYKIKCHKCNYASEEFYRRGKKISEYWITEYSLKQMKDCPCCGKIPKIVVKGENDLATTDPWMMPYFKNIEDCYRYTAQSSAKVDMVCIDCCRERKGIISNLYRTKYLPCECRDSTSIPNRIAYYTLSNIPEIQKSYDREYSPKWANNYRYDNYFKYNNKRYIIEMDGGIGHGNFKYKSSEIDIEGLERDKLKDKLAKKHNIILYRVNCINKSDVEILDNLIKVLNVIFNQTIQFDRKQILLNAMKSLSKEICDLYNQGLSIKEIAKNKEISTGSVTSYLHKGNDAGFCAYITQSDEKKKRTQCIKQLIDDNLYTSTADVANKLDCHPSTIISCVNTLGEPYVSIVSKIGIDSRTKASVDSSSKTVYVYDLGLNFIKKYSSQNEIERLSENDFGVNLRSRAISRVCLGQRRQYKGYIFSFTELNKNIKD